MDNNISRVVARKECCGCGACINICKVGAIEHSNDIYGFVIPKLNIEKCIQCGQCMRVCAAEHKEANTPVEAYASMALDTEERFDASSGGIFGVVSKAFIESGGIVYGAKMDEKFHVHHEAAVDEKTRKSLLRSKYIQSDMGTTYIDIMDLLKKGKKVLFSGTPCQVSAVKNFVPEKYRENLFLIDVVCHGVPSQKFFDSYITYLTEKEGIVESYQFRAKRQVNNGMNWYFGIKVKGKHEVIKNWPEDTFNYLYMKSYIYRDSCYSCPYASEDRCSDLTLCDYWGWSNYQTSFKFGSTVSGVLVNSDKGKKLLNTIEDKLVMEKADIENIKRHNGCLVSPPKYSDKREQILGTWKSKGFAYIDHYYKKHNRKMILKSKIMRMIPADIMNALIRIRLKMAS